MNTFVAYLLFVWLPAILVTAALIGHILVWRKLAAQLIGAVNRIGFKASRRPSAG